jgi:hypothetical protein
LSLIQDKPAAEAGRAAATKAKGTIHMASVLIGFSSPEMLN